MDRKDQTNRIVMMGSGAGTTIDYFCKEAKKGRLKARIVALISDRKQTGLGSIAKKYSLPFHLIEYKKPSLKKWEEELLEKVSFYKPHLVLLAGFLRKIPTSFLAHFPDKVLNSHPSLLPEFAGEGMYGLRVHEAVIQSQKEKTGVSIHVVNENWDAGPLLSQQTLAVLPNETALELEGRIKKIEKELYVKTVSERLKQGL